MGTNKFTSTSPWDPERKRRENIARSSRSVHRAIMHASALSRSQPAMSQALSHAPGQTTTTSFSVPYVNIPPTIDADFANGVYKVDGATVTMADIFDNTARSWTQFIGFGGQDQWQNATPINGVGLQAEKTLNTGYNAQSRAAILNSTMFTRLNANGGFTMAADFVVDHLERGTISHPAVTFVSSFHSYPFGGTFTTPFKVALGGYHQDGFRDWNLSSENWLDDPHDDQVIQYMVPGLSLGSTQRWYGSMDRKVYSYFGANPTNVAAAENLATADLPLPNASFQNLFFGFTAGMHQGAGVDDNQVSSRVTVPRLQIWIPARGPSWTAAIKPLVYCDFVNGVYAIGDTKYNLLDLWGGPLDPTKVVAGSGFGYSTTGSGLLYYGNGYRADATAALKNAIGMGGEWSALIELDYSLTSGTPTNNILLEAIDLPGGNDYVDFAYGGGGIGVESWDGTNDIINQTGTPTNGSHKIALTYGATSMMSVDGGAVKSAAYSHVANPDALTLSLFKNGTGTIAAWIKKITFLPKLQDVDLIALSK